MSVISLMGFISKDQMVGLCVATLENILNRFEREVQVAALADIIGREPWASEIAALSNDD